MISRMHATIYEAGGEWFIKDEKTPNGVVINGRRVEPAQGCSLAEGDTGEQQTHRNIWYHRLACGSLT